MINAIKNLESSLGTIDLENDHKNSFLYFEVIGDLYIHLYLLMKEADVNLSELYCEYLNKCYEFYKESLKHKLALERENPYTYFDGLIGWPCLGIFIDYLRKKGVSNEHDLKAKFKIIKNKINSNSDFSNEKNVMNRSGK